MNVGAGPLLLVILLSVLADALEIQERIGEQPCRASHHCHRDQCCVARSRGYTYRTCVERPGLNEPCSTSMLALPHLRRPSHLYLGGCPCRHYSHTCLRARDQDATGVCRPIFERFRVLPART
ncbi:hypothetical protein MTO96_033735 [Rhipicephalus appendiculatus]